MGFFPCTILLARSTYAIFPHKCHRNVSLPSGASLWNGKFGRVEGQNTTLSILADPVILMASTRPLISKSTSPCTNHLLTVQSRPILYGITVTLILRSFFSSLAWSRYLSLFSFSFSLTQWSAGIFCASFSWTDSHYLRCYYYHYYHYYCSCCLLCLLGHLHFLYLLTSSLKNKVTLHRIYTQLIYVYKHQILSTSPSRSQKCPFKYFFLPFFLKSANLTFKFSTLCCFWSYLVICSKNILIYLQKSQLVVRFSFWNQ